MTVNTVVYYIHRLGIINKSGIFAAMAVKNELHHIIYYHRRKANLSRNELADLAGVGKTVIYDLEKGKQTTKWSTIISILDALNIDIEFSSPLMKEYEESINKNS